MLLGLGGMVVTAVLTASCTVSTLELNGKRKLELELDEVHSSRLSLPFLKTEGLFM